MTDRLREKARELVNAIGFDSMSAAMSYAGAEAATYAALLSARDEALEEAAQVCGARAFSVYGDEDLALDAAAKKIRSLKSKVTP